MEDPASTPDASHPLRADEARLERVLTAMWNQIHKVLRWPARKRGSGETDTRPERAIRGTGVSAEDILNDALLHLLQMTEPGSIRTWEGLAVTIADRRAKDALRKSQTGLRETSSRTRLRLVSGDEPVESSSGGETTATTVFDAHRESALDGEETYMAAHRAQALIDLARDVLHEREQRIILGRHCFGMSNKELGAELGLTPQRIGQIYLEAFAVLEEHPKFPYQDEDKEPGGANDEGT